MYTLYKITALGRYFHIFNVLCCYCCISKQETELYSRSVLFLHSNTDQHITSQNMLQFQVYFSLRWVMNCKPQNSTQAAA